MAESLNRNPDAGDPEIAISLAVLDGLVQHGFAVAPNLLSRSIVMELATDCADAYAAGEMTPARIGRGNSSHLDPAVRGDATLWLDAAPEHPIRERFLHALEALRRALNRSLMLGLETFEGHYAAFPAGAFYARHRDRFRDVDKRVLSLTCYLNADWSAADGGALRLWLPQGPLDIAPELGVSVLFISAQIEHEVLRANRTRYSIAGWFRRR